ncbi:hypothetical protein, partial [Enterobacter hormaechei]
MPEKDFIIASISVRALLTTSRSQCLCRLSSGLRRADTTARLRAEDAGATPEAAAQINSDDGLDGSPAN